MSEDNSKIAVFGALALGATAIALGLSEKKRQDQQVKEFFGQQQFSSRAVPTVASSVAAAQAGQMAAASPAMIQAAQAQAASSMPAGIQAAPNFQSAPPPRIFGGQIPASVSLKLPANKNMAFSASPFASQQHGTSRAAVQSRLGNSVIEGFQAFQGNGGGGNGQSQMNKTQPSLLPTSALAGGAAAIAASGDGNAFDAGDQPVMFDRNIFANIVGRNFNQGDYIRGDLAIAPNNSGWFQVSANPSIDLQPGALAVLGGTFNEQGQSIASLVNMASGGTKTAISGVNMSSSINTCLAGAGNDVTAIAFS